MRLRASSWWAMVACVVLGSGCCSTEEIESTFFREEDDEGRTCEEICRDAVVDGADDIELMSCDDVTNDGYPRVVCTFERTTCNSDFRM